jgi:hypothetical protein
MYIMRPLNTHWYCLRYAWAAETCEGFAATLRIGSSAHTRPLGTTGTVF